MRRSWSMGDSISAGGRCVMQQAADLLPNSPCFLTRLGWSHIAVMLVCICSASSYSCQFCHLLLKVARHSIWLACNAQEAFIGMPRPLSTNVWIAGGAFQGFMFAGNLGRLGNSIAIWLGIQPYELFFYVFLPPLLMDAAVRIDFFLFKKVCHCLMNKLNCLQPGALVQMACACVRAHDVEYDAEALSVACLAVSLQLDCA